MREIQSLAVSLLLVGCGSQQPSPLPQLLPSADPVTQISGKVTDIRSLSGRSTDLSQGTVHLKGTLDYVDRTIATANFSSENSFTLYLPSLSTIQPYLFNSTGLFSNCKGSIYSSNPSVNLFWAERLIVRRPEGGGELTAGTHWYGSNNSTGGYSYSLNWVFSDGETKLTGSTICQDATPIHVSLDVSLKSGWNLVARKNETPSTSYDQKTYKNGTFSELYWLYAEYF